MKKLFLILFFFFINIKAQINIQYLNDVPESFKKEYCSKTRNYNPLHVGDFWQYKGDGYYTNIIIAKDSILNGIKYSKKIIDYDERLVTWERNDSLGNSFMLDFEDLDEDGYYNDELTLDSLGLVEYSRYKTYKGMYKYLSNSLKEGLSALIYDTLWIVFENDTVLAKHVQYDICFCSEIICDKYGIILNEGDANPNELTGAIIDGKQFGTIVDIGNNSLKIPSEIELFNNYPNPFNPFTNINYQIPSSTMVTLKVYDVTGKEVAILVNERKSAGSYKTIFDASNLTSGIYYYRLTAGSKIITKSMILLK